MSSKKKTAAEIAKQVAARMDAVIKEEQKNAPKPQEVVYKFYSPEKDGEITKSFASTEAAYGKFSQLKAALGKLIQARVLGLNEFEKAEYGRELRSVLIESKDNGGFGLDPQRVSDVLKENGIHGAASSPRGAMIDQAKIQGILEEAVELMADEPWLVSTAIRRASEIAKKIEEYTQKGKPKP